MRSSLLTPLAVVPGVATPSAREKIRNRYFPNVTLRTHDDRVVKFYDDLVKDRIVTINFMYAECDGVCPLVTANLAATARRLGSRLGREIFMYSITLDPGRDTPKALRTYARDHGARPGWTFLTGAPADIERLRRALRFVDPDPEVDRDKSSHIGTIRYGNEPRMWWGMCPGSADPAWIAESISWVVRA